MLRRQRRREFTTDRREVGEAFAKADVLREAVERLFSVAPYTTQLNQIAKIRQILALRNRANKVFCYSLTHFKNDQKHKLCEPTEICLEKFVKNNFR